MKEFQKVITEMTSLFKKFTAIEQTKLRALQGNHIATVEDCMTKEQAMVLSLRGLEKKREECQEKAGYGGMKFQEMLSAVSVEERQELLPLFESFQREFQMFQEVNGDANEMLKTSLHMINKAMKQSGVYNEDGKKATQVQHMTNRRA